MKAEKKTFPN